MNAIKEPYRVLLALSEMEHLEAWVNLALRLAGEQGEVHLHSLLTIPEEQSLSEGAIRARARRDALDPLTRDNDRIRDNIRVHVDHQPMNRVLDEIQKDPVNLLLVQWMGPGTMTGGLSTEHILQFSPCDVVLLSGTDWKNDGSVLLSLRGGPNLSLGVEVARALAGDANITLFHSAENRQTAPDLEVLMRKDSQINRLVTARGNTLKGILNEAENHKTIVLGAKGQPYDTKSSAIAPIVSQVIEQTRIPLALVRAWQPETVAFHAPRLRRLKHEDISTRVDRWFAENTFDSNEFSDLSALMALKEKQGLTISVGLPALNEEETVGLVISTLKKSLMDDLPLVDEFVLIDSNSTDNTVTIAEDLGIKVYRHPDILPETGTFVGKGEALWKSLHALKGDLIAWVDTDITNIHPRFIYGLLGPLLKNPQVQYVKGFYQRPINVDGKLQAYGGGRVTELVARPLFNLFYPELSGIIQPLSGEYAGRRTALEQVPFFTGYGVETGLLLDLLDRYGLEAVAQTDLEVRVHHNQPLVGLSKMAFAILQVFTARLETRYGVQLLDKANRSMKLIIQEPDRFALGIAEITDQERQPMISVPAYQASRDKQAAEA